MKRRREIAALMALVGVVFHLALVTWHNTATLRASVEHASLIKALLETCHASQQKAPDPAPELPFIPRPDDSQSGCAICKGMVAAVAILSQPPVLPHRRMNGASRQMAAIHAVVSRRIPHAWTPSRAPPDLEA